MRIFCDTSVLVAACVRHHPHHARAYPVVTAVARGEDEGVISCHSLAEAYSALTSMPVQPRISPVEAEAMVRANIRSHFRLQPVTPAMYERALAVCAGRSLGGGKVYDALLIECARKAACERLYTFNVADFRKLAPELADRIAAP